VWQDETVQVTRNGGDVAFESAEGNVVYYDKLPEPAKSLWRAPVAGSTEEKLLEAVWMRSFAVVEDGIYFVRPPGAEDPFFSIQFLDFASGQATQVTSLDVSVNDPERSPYQGFTVSPDRRSCTRRWISPAT